MRARKERIEYWRERIAEKEYLSDEDYRKLLHEIRTNSAFCLLVKAIHQIDDGVQAYTSCLDKVHWLLDSLERKNPEQKKSKTDLGWNYETNDLDENQPDA